MTKYHYPRTLFTKSLKESIMELTGEFAKAIEEAIEEYTNMKLKEYMEHKKEVEHGPKNKRRSSKRASNRKSQPRKHTKKNP